ncbi:hypothetical protein N657DRAFT_687434 [Parathielavia appendiculata]|uniref:Uncharacterized protein n=1 Tax=Parathielavia appendiculata TaxID=2587402 RepID=A0AAN6U5Z1_9PEZI|nr:hypothetical protein N657DRAFT_687434 [Parathielavia appendiculata]
MAPSAPPPPRVRLTKSGRPWKRMGPAPKPLAERLKNRGLKEVKRVERSYTRERKIEVLLWLLNHRVEDVRGHRPRRRIGDPIEMEVANPGTEEALNGVLIWNRAPTYAEASQYWKIPVPTIQGWWDARKKILDGTGVELPEVGRGGPITLTPAPPGVDPHPVSTAKRLRGPSNKNNGEQQHGQRAASSTEQSVGTPATTPATPAAPAPNGALYPSTLNWMGEKSSNASGTRPASLLPTSPAGSGQPANVASLGPPAGLPGRPPAGKSKKSAAPAPQLPRGLPPAFDPANYVVVYIGPQPGPLHGQHCIHPGAILPVVHSGQPIEVAPTSFVSVYPSHPPPPGPRPPPPPPNATYIGEAVYPDPHDPPNPGQHPPHGPPGSVRSHPPSGQPHPPIQAPARSNGHRPLLPAYGPAGYVSPYAPPTSAAVARPPPRPIPRAVQAGDPRRPLAPTPQAPASANQSPASATNTAHGQLARDITTGPPEAQQQNHVAPPGQQPAESQPLPTATGTKPAPPAALTESEAATRPANEQEPSASGNMEPNLQRRGMERPDTPAPEYQEPPPPSAEDETPMDTTPSFQEDTTSPYAEDTVYGTADSAEVNAAESSGEDNLTSGPLETAAQTDAHEDTTMPMEMERDGKEPAGEAPTAGLQGEPSANEEGEEKETTTTPMDIDTAADQLNDELTDSLSESAVSTPAS